jgi:Mg2+/citrate symporter
VSLSPEEATKILDDAREKAHLESQLAEDLRLRAKRYYYPMLFLSLTGLVLIVFGISSGFPPGLTFLTITLPQLILTVPYIKLEWQASRAYKRAANILGDAILELRRRASE